MGTPQRDSQDVPQFARGCTGPYGKYDHELKTHVDETTFNLWLRLCNSKGLTSSELQRELLYLVLHGRTPSELAAQDTRALLNLEGTVAGLDRVGCRA